MHAIALTAPLLLAFAPGHPAQGQATSPSTSTLSMRSRGAALPAAATPLYHWEDFDQDGERDVYVQLPEGEDQLLRNRGGADFEDVTASLGLPVPLHARSVQWADLDGDGLPDLVLVTAEGSLRLWQNVVAAFVDVTDAFGILDDAPVVALEWLNADRAGLGNLHVLTETSDRVYVNQGGGRFLPALLPSEGASFARSSRVTGPGDAFPEISAICLPGLADQASPGACLRASSVPVAGMLYPLSSKLFVSPAGNVGVGTTSPIYPLTVQTGAFGGYGLVHTDGTVRVGTYVGSSPYAGWYGTQSNHDLAFFTNNGGAQMILKTNGRVGIGTTVPSARLTVVESAASADTMSLDSLGYASNAIRATSTGLYSNGVNASAFGNGSNGVFGSASGNIGRGVYGYASGTNGTGVWGSGPSGVLGQSTTGGYAVYSAGNFGASGTKSFQIDHPLDPENKLLNHYCTEAPEPLNVYSGVVVLERSGGATIELPAYCEEINKDFRYQLTPIGAPMPGLFVAERVSQNRFRIAGGAPGMEVSWSVSGVRNDLWVRTHGAPVEPLKSAEARGKYVQPELYGLGPERGMHYGLQQAAVGEAR